MRKTINVNTDDLYACKKVLEEIKYLYQDYDAKINWSYDFYLVIDIIKEMHTVGILTRLNDSIEYIEKLIKGFQNLTLQYSQADPFKYLEVSNLLESIEDKDVKNVLKVANKFYGYIEDKPISKFVVSNVISSYIYYKTGDNDLVDVVKFEMDTAGKTFSAISSYGKKLGEKVGKDATLSEAKSKFIMISPLLSSFGDLFDLGSSFTDNYKEYGRVNYAMAEETLSEWFLGKGADKLFTLNGNFKKGSIVKTVFDVSYKSSTGSDYIEDLSDYLLRHED